ncbi:hypothetical protein CLOSTASPAR_06117 [[Clostridium] asparagiforme DSM 15981]|uniref:Uncharacterized protein n=1 Tax=[Clostridium] asparagiforme DSM 15981 TaxID=518636 RepID=C0DA17_9FIRM|nr:hypothetical protein CLOSTASPAR_06117 [[Clostridium] asparagiforme DSM 15981]
MYRLLSSLPRRRRSFNCFGPVFPVRRAHFKAAGKIYKNY